MSKRISVCTLALVAILATHLSAGFAQERLKAASGTTDLMGGEKVLSVHEAPLLNPLRRFDEHPWFEITNLRPGRNLQDALEMNFACSGPLEGQFHVVVTTNGKRHHFPLDGDLLKKRRGVITCKYSFLDDKSPFGADIEAYIELTDDEPKTTSTTVRLGSYGRYGGGRYGRGGFGPSRYSSYTYKRTEANDPLFFKVSQSATRGNVPALTYSREIRPDELRLYTARRKKNGPPPPPPEGALLASALSTPLVPGTPVLAAFEGDWLPAEVLSVHPESQYLIHWPGFGHDRNMLMPRAAIALDEGTQKRLASSPDSFSPSVVVPQGSLRPIPDGYIVPPINLTLLPGTPVHVYISTMAHTYTVTNDKGNDVHLVHDNHGTIKHVARRAAVTITSVTAKELEKPETKGLYAARLKKILESGPRRLSSQHSARVTPMSKPSGYKSSTRHYGIAIEIPKDYVAVTSETPLKTGMAVQAYWGSKFNDAEVRELQEDGGVVIHWKGWSSVYAVTRETLIVSRETLASLEGTQEKMPTSDAKKQTSATFRLSLQKAGVKKIPLIKVVMAITGFDLPTAKEVVDNAPIDIKDGLSESEAADWRKKFEATGAQVDLQPSKQKPVAAE